MTFEAPNVTNDPDDVSSYDYDLPPDLIASTPAARRDQSRLLIVDRSTDRIAHGTVGELPQFLSPGDLLVLNDTRVVPARLRGLRERTGGKWEGLFLRADESGRWEILGQTRGRVLEGESILVSAPAPSRTSLRLVLEARREEGVWSARPESDGHPFDLLDEYGEIPLPPYIRKMATAEDRERYQTVYARTRGSVAAPTAGLHFTDDLLAACEARGIGRTRVTLHVGIGTFRPVVVDRLGDHVMHAEWGELTGEAAVAIGATRAAGGRVVSVGTTSVRVLETAAASGEVAPFRGETSLFIRPPYRFQAVDSLMTNFHLPRSTLLVLVSTFAGRELIRRAYEEAIRERYRFFSYGDAMLIL